VNSNLLESDHVAGSTRAARSAPEGTASRTMH
jgi:hypothetical protein